MILSTDAVYLEELQLLVITFSTPSITLHNIIS